MKLASMLVEKTLSQFDAKAIPDDHPIVPQLTKVFGDHTFFLDENGLNIVEPTEPTDEGAAAGMVMNVANWSDEDQTSLAPHRPDATDIVVVLGGKPDGA
jgi:hypothetical protein